MPKKANSRRKGKEGELHVAALIREYGVDKDARRKLEFQGVDTGRDIELPNIKHFSLQVKRHKRISATVISAALVQANHGCDSGYSVPVAVHKSDREDWRVTMLLSDWLNLVKEWKDGRY